MKMFLIVYSREADEDIVAAFKSSGITGYTKMQEVRGEGKETEPKLGTHIWPGMNNILFLVMDDDEVPPIKELIKRLKQEHPRAGLKGFLIPLEDCL
jgi:nitrogen regulatory protein PII